MNEGLLNDHNTLNSWMTCRANKEANTEQYEPSIKANMLDFTVDFI